MGFFNRIRAAATALFGGGGGTVYRPMGDWPTRTVSGERVSAESALTLSTYFGCLRNLGEDVAKLPLVTYRQAGRGKEKATNHPLYRLLHDQPNDNQSSFAFREQLTTWAAAWGIGCAEIAREPDGRPSALWPIHPSRVEIRTGTDGREFFRVHNDPRTGRYEVLDYAASDILCVEGFARRSIARHAAESLGLSMAAQTFGAAYYGNGMGLSVAILHPGRLSQQAHNNMRSSWAAMHQGADKAHKPFIGEEGVKIEKLSVPAEEAQFLQTRQFQVEEVCRWFRMPPYKAQNPNRAQGWSTLEATNADYIGDTLMPWFERWENEISRKLLFESERQSMIVRFNVSALLRADAAARADFYTKMFNIGALSQNDIRELEDMNPIESGDTYYVPLNMRASDEVVTTETEAANAVASPADTASNEDEPDEAKIARGHIGILSAEIQRCVDREAKALERAAQKHAADAGAFNKWADDFYASQTGYVEEAVTPGLASLAMLTGKGSASAAIGFANEFVSQSRGMLESAYANGSIPNLCETWTASRAPEAATNLVQRILGQ